MAQELQYTSVPQGLKPGSRGFCAVVMTRGMSQSVATRLESLSGYDMYYRVGSPSVDHNPPHFAHWIVTIDGKPANVLSYIAYAGMDYNGRANKFAHHILLDDADKGASGPAWLLQQGPVVERTYTPPPRQIDPRKMPHGNVQPGVCQHWVREWGDAGWAGALAQCAMDEPARPAYVVYPIRVSPLPLVAEAIALLPPELRWRATFSTYFSRLPPDMVCNWRFCLEGTDAAKEARAAAGRALVIDFAGDRKPAPASPMVIAARNAGLAMPEPTPPPVTSAPTAVASSPSAIPAAVPTPTAAPRDEEPLKVYDSNPAAPPLHKESLDALLDISVPGPKKAPAERSSESGWNVLDAGASSAGGSLSGAPGAGGSLSGGTSAGSSAGGSSAGIPQTPPPKPRPMEPLSMADLGNEEVEEAHLEEAIQRQKKAKEIKRRAGSKPRDGGKAADEGDPDDSGATESPVDATGHASGDSDMGQSVLPESLQQAPSRAADKPAAKPASKPAAAKPASAKPATKPAPAAPIKPAVEAIPEPAPPPPPAPEPAPAAAIEPDEETPASKKPMVFIGIAVAVVLLAGVGAFIRSRQHAAAPVVENLAGAAVDAQLAPRQLTPAPVPTRREFVAVPLRLDAPGTGEPVPATTVLVPSTTAISLRLHTPPPGEPAAFWIEEKPASAAVVIACEPIIHSTGKVAVGEFAIDKGRLVWRWTHAGPWNAKLQKEWAKVAPMIQQSVAELSDSSRMIESVQLCVPLSITLQQATGSAILPDLQPAAASSISVEPLPAGWKSESGGPSAALGSPLQLSHPSGATLNVNTALTRSIWTVLANWPPDSRADELAASLDQIDRDIAQRVALKSSPATLADAQGDIDRTRDELERMKTQISQAKVAGASAEEVKSLESRRDQLNQSVLKLKDRLERIKAAPAEVEVLQSQRKSVSERLGAVRALASSRLVIAGDQSKAVLAVVHLVNPSPPPENAAPAPPSP